MPRTEIDYSKTIIYKIVCNDLNVKDVYVGSTTNFRARKNKHKSCCNTETSYKIYDTIRDNGGWENWTMLEIEKFSCKDNNEARTRERYWLEQLQASLNIILPIATKEETKQKQKQWSKKYRVDNKEEIKQYHANNYIENKEEIDARNKQYREENKEKEKERAKKYREEHAEEIKKKNAEYYMKNKEEINARNAKWREENPEKEKERARRRDPEKEKERGKIYRAKNKEKEKERKVKWLEKKKNETA